MAYHDLSIKLWNKAVSRVESIKDCDRWKMDDFDKTIRTFLSEKAKELGARTDVCYGIRSQREAVINEILGLSVEEPKYCAESKQYHKPSEPCNAKPYKEPHFHAIGTPAFKDGYACYCTDGSGFEDPTPQPSSSKEWWRCRCESQNIGCKFCPNCGWPRPKKLTLVDKLIDAYKKKWGVSSVHTPDFELFASVAEAHYQDRG